MPMIETIADIPSVGEYLKRVGAEARSLSKAVVREIRGSYWRDIAVIHISKTGAIQAPAGYEPTDSEKARIEADAQNYTWPTIKLLREPGHRPPAMLTADPRDVFTFRDEEGNIKLVQVRKELKDGNKAYIPYTYWSDDRWRSCEPDDELPLWGLEFVKDHTTVIIHEGAKAASVMHNMANGTTPEGRKKMASHPWAVELSSCAHVGWCGGALNPGRTDWSVLHRLGIKRAYIVADNDAPGRSAVPKIAERLRMVSFHIQFTSEWPPGFDLADDFPASMFQTIDGRRYYCGPQFQQVLHPGTWMTDLVPVSRTRTTPALRDHAKELWAYVESVDLFVCTAMPSIVRDTAVLNKSLSSFSHSHDTARLIAKSHNGRFDRLAYCPGNPGLIITDKTTSAINLHTPSLIKPTEGSVGPFIDFLNYMFPFRQESHQVQRWCATMISQPSTRMEFGLLLVSESQGVGKTTLGSTILAPLVGIQNTGWPSEKDIVESAFNGWCAQKRLLIVNEIYSGHSWRAYNSLKSIITDKEIEINQKFQRPYLIENWAHIIACSNSMRALRMEEDDRRWFYPELTEQRWDREDFAKLRAWLSGGGLGIIRNWADQFGDYVLQGERAPMTARKKELIEGSRSEGQREAIELAQGLASLGRPAALGMKAIVESIRQGTQGRVHDTDYELRKAMREVGIHQFHSRIRFQGRLQYVMMNSELNAMVSEAPAREEELLRGHSCNPSEIVEPSM